MIFFFLGWLQDINFKFDPSPTQKKHPPSVIKILPQCSIPKKKKIENLAQISNVLLLLHIANFYFLSASLLQLPSRCLATSLPSPEERAGTTGDPSQQ